MINRYSCAINKEKFSQLLNIPRIKSKIKKDYNIAPTDSALVLLRKRNGVRFEEMEWGLIPSNNKSPVNSGNLFNARVENLPSSPSFRIPFRKYRCLIPADSYYIFDQVNGNKIPYRISLRSGRAFFCAGLYDRWSNDKMIKKTYSMISSEVPIQLDSYGQRMPIIFTSLDSGMEWLNSTSVKGSKFMLENQDVPDLKIYRITDDIMDKNLNNSELHEEYHRELTLFD